MIDRLVHHADVIALKGDSDRLKNRDLGRPTAASTTDRHHERGSLQTSAGVRIQPSGLDPDGGHAGGFTRRA